MAYGPAATRDAATERTLSCFEDIPVFDAVEFDGLCDMIGEDGALEMVMIFEAETRQRLRRLMAGHQDIATQVREMHTLKGAAGTVASPRLAAMGEMLEHAADQGIAPGGDDIDAIEAALEDYLRSVRARNEQLAPAL